ncbi:hypothetical protein VDGD_05728 [Verticillium dahliae]|nr:hypothetical protein VdG1_08700 [Verticillium dahliae VDG1]RBQ74569.1 hypothetical protein VDGD_05728 [Verticillium dahliae]
MSSLVQTWYRWKMLRLPWRKQFLIGRDLKGNTFWEFREQRGDGPGRFRRIVKPPRSTHYSEVNVSPLWHQWLRYTRENPPSIEEQSNDEFRQERMKTLAAQADARWEAKPRVMDAPGRDMGQPVPALDTSKTQPIAPERVAVNEARDDAARAPTATTQAGAAAPEEKKPEQDPWKKARGAGEGWQPEAWTPGSTRKR